VEKSNGRNLYRAPQEERKIFGVCGGLAEYFDFSVALLRIAFVAATIFSSVLGYAGVAPIIVYCGLALVMKNPT